MNADIWIKIASVAFTAVSVLWFFIIKKIFDEFKEIRAEFKEIRSELKEIRKTLEEHGNRLTAIETGLKMFEWFEFKKSKAQGDEK